MTGTMINRIAKAIYHAQPRNKPFEKLEPVQARYWEKRAIAAVQAMPRPSEAVILAAYQALMDWDARTGEDAGIRDIWRAMLDAILSEHQRGQG